MGVQDVPKVHDPSFRGDVIIRFLPDSDQVLARMDRSTVQVFTNLADYLQLYGPYVDRVGYSSDLATRMANTCGTGPLGSGPPTLSIAHWTYSP